MLPPCSLGFFDSPENHSRRPQLRRGWWEGASGQAPGPRSTTCQNDFPLGNLRSQRLPGPHPLLSPMSLRPLDKFYGKIRCLRVKNASLKQGWNTEKRRKNGGRNMEKQRKPFSRGYIRGCLAAQPKREFLAVHFIRCELCRICEWTGRCLLVYNMRNVGVQEKIARRDGNDLWRRLIIWTKKTSTLSPFPLSCSNVRKNDGEVVAILRQTPNHLSFRGFADHPGFLNSMVKVRKAGRGVVWNTYII